MATDKFGGVLAEDAPARDRFGGVRIDLSPSRAAPSFATSHDEEADLAAAPQPQEGFEGEYKPRPDPGKPDAPLAFITDPPPPLLNPYGDRSTIKGRPPLSLPEGAAESVASEVASQFHESINRPAIAIPRMEGNDPRVMGFLSGALGRPVTEKESQVISGTFNTAKGFAEFMESPLGVATMATGAAGKVVQKIVAGLFALQIGSHTKESAEAFGKATVEGTPQEVVETGLGLATTVLLPATLGKAAVGTSLAETLGAVPSPAAAIKEASAKAAQNGAPLTALATGKTLDMPLGAKPPVRPKAPKPTVPEGPSEAVEEAAPEAPPAPAQPTSFDEFVDDLRTRGNAAMTPVQVQAMYPQVFADFGGGKRGNIEGARKLLRAAFPGESPEATPVTSTQADLDAAVAAKVSPESKEPIAPGPDKTSPLAGAQQPTPAPETAEAAAATGAVTEQPPAQPAPNATPPAQAPARYPRPDQRPPVVPDKSTTGPAPIPPLHEPPGGVRPGTVVPEQKPTATKTPEQEYDAARKSFGVVSKAFGEAQRKYRAREIGDDEFLKSRAEFQKAQDTFDKAESKFIEAKNTPAEPAKGTEGEGDLKQTAAKSAKSDVTEGEEPDAIPALESETPATLERDRKADEKSISDMAKMGYSEEVIRSSSAAERVPKDRVAQLIKESKPEGPATKAKALADKLRDRFKTPGADVSSFGPLNKVIDAAVEVAARIIEAGGTVAEAMQKAIEHVKANYSGNEVFDEADFRKKFEGLDEGGVGAANYGEVEGKGGEDITGIAQRVREKVAASGQEELPPRGKGISPEASVELGDELLAAGADPEKAMAQFESTGRSSSYDVALVRAQLTNLASFARRIEEASGTDSPEFKAAFRARSDWAARVKKMQTDWARKGAAQQGEVDIDTGTFTGLQSEYTDATGNEFTPDQSRTAKKIAKNVKEARDSAGTAQQNTFAQLDKDVGERVKRTNAERDALDAAWKTVREAAARRAEAENKLRVADAGRKQAAEDLQRLASDLAKGAADKTVREAAVGQARAEAVKRVADAQRAKDVAKVRLAAEQRAEKAAQSAVTKAASKHAAAVRELKGDPMLRVWEKAKEYLEKGMDNFDEIRHKVATDLGMKPDQVARLLAQSKRAKYLIDDLWRKQQAARHLDQQAKLWVKAAATPLLNKALSYVPRFLFSVKVGFHGTVALGTHAPMVAFQPAFWETYVNNFGKMYRMVVSKAYYEMQVQDLMRKPNYTLAQRAGLVNDPFHYEDYNSPQAMAWLGKYITAPGTRGYAVLKTLRQDMFDQHWNKLPKTAQIPEMAAAISDAVNHATGVVQVQAPKGANIALFAPRLEMSRVAWLAADPARAVATGLNWKNATEAEKYFAINQVKEKAWVVGTLAGLLALNQGFLTASGSDQKINFDDPFHSDFLKFKAAGMTISYGNAMLTMARLPVRLYRIRESSGGKLKNVIYPDENTYSVLGEYGRSQLSPFASLAADLWLKGDWQNRPLPNSSRPVPKRLRAQGVEPYTWPEFWTEQMLPIPFEEAAREVWKNGLGMSPEQVKATRKALATLAIMSGTGARLTDDVPYKQTKQ